MKFQEYLSLTFLFLVAGCTSTPTPQNSTPPALQAPQLGAQGRMQEGDKVWVIRPDGAQSCGVKEGLSPQEDAKNLQAQGIQTFSFKKGQDGLMHMQMCGAPKGSVNGYLILKSDLAKALTLGFKAAPLGFSN